MDLYIYGTLGALLIGIAKTGVPGVGIAAVPLLATAVESVYPGAGAKSSVGWLLPMLILADIWAVSKYWRHTDWAIMKKLVPWIVFGLAVGFLFYSNIRAEDFKPMLGVLVLVMLGLDLLRRAGRMAGVPKHPAFTGFVGTATGASTALANLAGPVMNVYFLCLGFDKVRFMATGAVLFFLVNLSKVPFFIWQGAITPESLVFNLKMVPAICVGALLGFWLLPRVPQKVFDGLVTFFVIASALKLLAF